MIDAGAIFGSPTPNPFAQDSALPAAREGGLPAIHFIVGSRRAYPGS